MTTTLSDIKTNVRSKINKGTSEDSNLYSYIKKAVKHVEKKANFTWMYHLNTTGMDPEADFPRTLRTATRTVRAIDFIKVTHEDGEELDEYVSVNQALTMARWGVPEEDYPGEYFLVQEQLIYFKNTPAAEYTLEVGWWEYSDFPNVDTVTHYLFEHHSELVEEIALMYYARKTRDFQRAQQILANFTPELDDLVAEQEDKKAEDAEVIMVRDFASENMG